MKTFSDPASCDKCGHSIHFHSMKYHHGKMCADGWCDIGYLTLFGGWKYEPIGEHLNVVCARCKFTWQMEVKSNSAQQTT